MRKPLATAATAVALLIAAPASAQLAAEPSSLGPRDRLITYLTGLAREQAAARRAAVAAIATPMQAHERQVQVRATIADLIRLDHAGGPVRSATTHVDRRDGYAIEALWYESLPGFRVTADLYRPQGKGPFPAIIVQPGHGTDGKIGNHGLAANLARAGFVVLSVDIVGEGERVQFHDPATGASRVGRPTGEHSMAFEQAMPIGGHVSRFFIQDALRGIDYLTGRPDVDGRRIGAFGCSGGGTITAYLAALDPRIAATAVGCYVNDMDHLLEPGGPGPQDAEQSIPFFLERGLDLPDWVEAVAPRPFAVVSTTGDMFPIAGARDAYAEASRFYKAMGAADRITMIEGPGGHGALQPISPAIVAFFTRWLQSDPVERPFRPEPVGDPMRLLVFPDSSPGTAPGSRMLSDVIADDVPRADALPRPRNRAALCRAIREIARTTVVPGGAAPPGAALDAATPREGYSTAPFRFDAAAGLRINGVYARSDKPGSRPTLLLLAPTPLSVTVGTRGLLDAWARAGWNVLAIEPRGAGGTEELKSPLTGDWTLLSLRALMVGRTPVGMRTDDALSALNWLAARSEVDRGRMLVHGIGALGPVALHVGVLDPRVSALVSEDAITRYRDIAERPISRNAAEVNLPGVLERYDLPDLMAVLGSRLTLVNPVNVVGEPLRPEQWATIVPATVRVTVRAARDPVGLPPLRR